MSKINCDICGTSYPDTASQCPICGCVRSADSTPAESVSEGAGSYTHVRGGRFSRSNVRKRNQGKPVADMPPVREEFPEDLPEEGERQDKGLLLAVCLLLLAIVAVVIYIITRFFAPETPDPNGGSLIRDPGTESTTITEPAETTEPTLPETTGETVEPTVEETVETTQPATQPETQPATQPDNNYYVKPFKTNKDKQGNDASTPKGTSFPLKLFDATGELMDVEWLVEDPTICSVEGNTVTGLKRGVTKVYVVIDGETYYCVVRIT